MRKIVLISCVKVKLNHPAKAKELYISDLFKKFYAYAQSLSPDKIYILSAKYGLLDCDQIIEPYDLTLNTMGVRDRKAWSLKVIKQLAGKSNLDQDKYIFLAGDKYRRYLLPHIKNFEIPLKGLRVGEQKSWLKKRIENGTL